MPVTVPVPVTARVCRSEENNGTVCGHGVGAADILLAPGAGGSVRLHGDLEPVSGDFVIKPAERIAVRKQAGVVGAGECRRLCSCSAAACAPMGSDPTRPLRARCILQGTWCWRTRRCTCSQRGAPLASPTAATVPVRPASRMRCERGTAACATALCLSMDAIAMCFLAARVPGPERVADTDRGAGGERYRWAGWLAVAV